MDLSSVLAKAKEILNLLIPVFVSLGIVYFVWGIVAYVIGGGEEAKKKGRDRIIYGIIGLAVIVSVWGVVNIVSNTFGLGGTTTPARQQVSSACNTKMGILNPPSGTPPFQYFVEYVNCTISDSIIPFLFAVALAVFVWGVVKFFIINADEEAKRTQGKQFMIWGIIAIVVMLSVWGLVGILGNTLGINSAIPQTKE
jgi:hypothetical protein